MEISEYRTTDDLRSEVHEMIQGINRYNPGNLPLLQTYLRAQCREDFSDLDANLTMLKLYQFSPELTHEETAALILVKALMNLPRSDFILCKCLLRVDSRRDKLLNAVLAVGRSLEQCSFEVVWPAVKDLQGLFTEEVVGLESALRGFACSVISDTYRKIPEEDLLRYLGYVDDKTLSACMEKHGWTRDDEGNMITCALEKLVKSKTVDEGLDFDKVAAIMAFTK